MIIIETCPVCGHDLRDVMICTNPPIPRKECNYCGWSWEGKQEDVVRVPFGGYSDNTILNDLTKYNKLEATLDDMAILNNINFEDARVSTFENSSCTNCSNNPKNGGSGICFCTLGQPEITY